MDAVEQRNPRLAAISGHNLDETTPYLWPRDGTLTLFLCRWPTGATIPVAFPFDTSAEEEAALEAALRAWEGAGLGVRFQRVEQGREQLTILFLDATVETAKGEGVGSSVVDCRLDLEAGAAEGGGSLQAEIVHALVRVGRRTPQNVLHRDKALTPEQQTGIVLHELGHALGFQGHPSHGDTSMQRSRDEISQRGRAALAGKQISDASVRALYALPPGTVLRRIPVSPARTEPLDRLADAAARAGLRGPYLRVGDRDGRVFWRDAQGEEYGVVIAEVARTLREPDTLVLMPEPRTRALLDGAAPRESVPSERRGPDPPSGRGPDGGRRQAPAGAGAWRSSQRR